MAINEQEAVCQKAAQIIRSGGVVAFPTETVYGLGADAFNSRAVAKIFAVKKRPQFDPLIVHIHNLEQLQLIASEIPFRARDLVKRFWPGPLTIVVPKKPVIPDIVTSGLPNVGVRMPNHPLALQLIEMAGTPVAAPSANLFGSISPTCADHVREQLGKQVSTIIDGGPCSVGIESTIISFAQRVPTLLRPGGIPAEEIEKILGPLHVPGHDALTSASPGRSLRHYSPDTPVFIGATPMMMPDLRKGLLTFTPEQDYIVNDFSVTEVLSVKGDLNEAACNLFSALRRLDNANLDIIIVKLVPDRGLGVAINDRLFRAAQSRRTKTN